VRTGNKNLVMKVEQKMRRDGSMAGVLRKYGTERRECYAAQYMKGDRMQ